MLLLGVLCLGFTASVRACSSAGLEILGVGMPATQSSQLGDWAAGLAIDGNTTQYIYDGSCSCTKLLPVPMFWAVDLQGIYRLERVKIFNRLGCCAYRLTDFRVYIGQTELTYVEVVHHPGSVDETVKFDLSGHLGRFLKIEKYSHEHLSLCEVEIYGYTANCPGHFARVPGLVGTGAVLKSTAVASSLHCASICSSNPACRGYNVRQNGDFEICEILDTAEYAIDTGNMTFFLRE